VSVPAAFLVMIAVRLAEDELNTPVAPSSVMIER
jgi:hypothetical protein